MKWSKEKCLEVEKILKKSPSIGEALLSVESELGFRTTWNAIRGAFKRHLGKSAWEVFLEGERLPTNIQIVVNTTADPTRVAKLTAGELKDLAEKYEEPTKFTYAPNQKSVPTMLSDKWPNTHSELDRIDKAWKEEQVQKSLKRILIVPDTHVPFENARAFELMLKVGQKLKPDIIACLGDFADFYCISRYSKNPNKVSQFAKEVEAVNERLDQLDELGAERKIYICGNHEQRLPAYLEQTANPLFSSTSIEKELRLEERNWEFVEYHQHAKIGKLYLTHDVSASGSNSFQKAASLFEKNIITGHTHNIAVGYFGNALDEHHFSATLGWLGDATKVDYMSHMKIKKSWMLGFGWLLMEPDGTVYLQSIPIVNYKCVVDGELFVG